MTKYIIVDEIKILIITFVGQEAIPSKIFQLQAKFLLTCGTYCSSRIEKEIKDIGIWYIIMNKITLVIKIARARSHLQLIITNSSWKSLHLLLQWSTEGPLILSLWQLLSLGIPFGEGSTNDQALVEWRCPQLLWNPQQLFPCCDFYTWQCKVEVNIAITIVIPLFGLSICTVPAYEIQNLFGVSTSFLNSPHSHDTFLHPNQQE